MPFETHPQTLKMPTLSFLNNLTYIVKFSVKSSCSCCSMKYHRIKMTLSTWEIYMFEKNVIK